MKEEIASGWINKQTILDSYKIAQDKRHRMWLFLKWQRAILEKVTSIPEQIYLLQINSDRAVHKVLRRHWWEAQTSGKKCECYKCAFLKPVVHLVASDEYLREVTFATHPQAQKQAV